MSKQLIRRHIYSFAKTFLAVFISVLYFEIQRGGDIFTSAFWSAIIAGVLRTVYKLFVEDYLKKGVKVYKKEDAQFEPKEVKSPEHETVA